MIAPVQAVVLWTDTDTTLVHENGIGRDILGGSVKRDDSANDTLYFKFHVDPLSDKDTEDYFAGLELFDGGQERFGIGNALKAWAYSAYFHADDAAETNGASTYIDLRTLKPEFAAGGTSASYQYPRRGVGATIVFKVQFVPGEDDLVTVWLNPDLGPGANEAYQPEGLTTRFNANASFDEIRLRHSGRGGGWSFSDLAIATSFSDFVDVSGARPNGSAPWIADSTRAFTFQSWQKEQGLAAGSVRALTQTRDGYLWIGGNDELVRFDGTRFVSFGIQEGIRTGPVNVLLEDGDDALWAGSAGHGLGCWKDNQFKMLTTRDGLPGNTISALAEGSNGCLWIGTDSGLTTLQKGSVQQPKSSERFNGRPITFLSMDPRGQLWVGVKGMGVFQHDRDQFVPVVADAYEELLKDSHCLLIDKSGRVWIGAGEDSVLCRTDDRWSVAQIPRNPARSYVSTLAQEADGTVWAGSVVGGLVQFKDGRPVAVPADCGLKGKAIQALLADEDGKLWAGTDTGLNRLRRKTLSALSQGEGLGFGAAQGMAEVTPGVIWVAKPNDGLYRWDGRSFNRLPATGLSQHGSQITSLLVTHDGACWVATTNSLMLYKDPVAAADEVKVITPAKPWILSMAEDNDGALWMGTREGRIWQLRENQWVEPTNFFQTNAITAIVPDNNGSIWFGTAGNGIFRLSNGRFQHLDTHETSPADWVQTLFFDAQGTLWIGTMDRGLSWWRDGRFFHFTSQEGLPDNNVVQILEDDAGRLWLGTSRGIACVDKSQLNELVLGKRSAIYPQVFGRAAGMLSEECTGGFSPAGLKTKSGLLWFSTLKGVVAVNPRVYINASAAPEVVLEDVRVDGVPDPSFHHANHQSVFTGVPGESPVTATLRITPGKHRVEFQYTSVNFDTPDLVHFRCRLEGIDNDWVDAGTRRTAFYPYLPPGNYRFHVAASGGEGIWTGGETDMQLVVLRHYWQTWWFDSLAGLSGIMSIIGVVRFVEKRKHQRRLELLEHERALERERSRIAHDLHDEMGAKLCRISFLSEHARRGELPPQELQDQITSISVASREVLHSLDEIVWAVNPQNDTLDHVGSYIGQYAEEYFQMTGIQCELDIPTQLPPYPLSSQMRHQLFLATHEAITNILKHSGATHAWISMKFSASEFEIQIRDDGKGFDCSGAQSKNGRLAAGPSGDGLKNMSERLSEIGGRCFIESQPGRGASIRFVIPMKAEVQITQ